MAAGPTTIAGLTAEQFAARLAAGFPAGWSSPDALQPGGTLNKLNNALGAEFSFETDSLIYALDATRLQTAEGDALDAASVDFFGTGFYRIPRAIAETDTSYRARLQAAMLPPGATRSAMQEVVEKVTGFPARLTEGFSPAQTGVIDGLPGEGMMFIDVDTEEAPGRITDWLPYQGFVQCSLPVAEPLGNNATPCIDCYTMNIDVAGSSMFDLQGGDVLSADAVYDAINRTKVFGTVVWVQFVPPPGSTWDSGLEWDQSGLIWR